MKKVLVTGGAGFIGSNLVDALVKKGYDVHIIDNLVTGKKEQVNASATLHVADITQYETMVDIFTDVETVFHLAAIPSVQFSIDQPKASNEINVEGLVNVLNAAKATGVKRVVFSASSAAYGDQTIMPLVEDMEAHPKSPYGLQKYIGELYCKLWSEVYGLETVSLRYFNVYGPRQNDEGAYISAIARFLRQKREGKIITITGDGLQTRDFVHVSDVVRANILAMESDRVGKGEVINIGAGSQSSIKKIAELVGGPVEYIPSRLEPKDSRADTTRAKTLLDWEPTVSIEEGIAALQD